jgi:hypothetical protein
MFLLYHSEGCNICELVLHECYVNNLYTTTCSGMLGHHKTLHHTHHAVMLLIPCTSPPYLLDQGQRIRCCVVGVHITEMLLVAVLDQIGSHRSMTTSTTF